MVSFKFTIEFASLSKFIWKYFKGIIFSSIVIIQPFIEYLATSLKSGVVLHADQSKNAIENIYLIYSNLQFVSQKFGPIGISTINQHLQIMAGILLLMNPTSGFLQQQLESLNPEVADSCSAQSKLIFYLAQCKDLMYHVEYGYNVKVIDFIWPSLAPKTHIKSKSLDSNIFYLSHTLFHEVFEISIRNQGIIRNYTLDYFQMLVDVCFFLILEFR